MRSAALLVMLAGCYFELGTGYYPTIKQTIRDPAAVDPPAETTGGGWGVTFKLGFYLDVPIAPLRTGIGVGWSPDSFGGDPVLPGSGRTAVTAKGTTFRGDLTLPFIPFSKVPNVRMRLTAVYSSLTGAGMKRIGEDDYMHQGGATGTAWFVGPTIGASSFGSAALLSIGYQTVTTSVPYDDIHDKYGLDMSAKGFGVRILIGWTPGGLLFKHYTPDSQKKTPIYDQGVPLQQH